MRLSLFLVIAAFCIATGGAAAPQADPLSPDPNAPRPMAARDSVFIEELTWMEIRDALRAGKDTVIIATGGVEQNGPYLVTGKHNVILRGTTEAIARKLGNALVAPIVPFVPEGEIDPPSMHMKYPGSISLAEDTYERMLVEICQCFRVHGFKKIVLIGDSGGNQDGMKAVAQRLRKDAAGKGRVEYIPEYFDNPAITAFVEREGIKQTPEGWHDDVGNTAQMIAVDPMSVRMQERIAAGNFRINGVDLAPAERTIALGKRIIAMRADSTVAAIRKRFAQ